MRKIGLVLGVLGCVVWLGKGYCQQKPVASYGFEPGESEDWKLLYGADIINDKKYVISGKGSLICDTLESDGEWHEFFQSNPEILLLEPKGTYTVYFKYKILEKKENCKFYFLTRSRKGGAGPNDKGWTEIKDSAGTSSAKAINFTLADFDDYYLIIGTYKQGVFVIDDVKVFKGTVDPKELGVAPEIKAPEPAKKEEKK